MLAEDALCKGASADIAQANHQNPHVGVIGLQR
jgi:hypothetical protein